MCWGGGPTVHEYDTMIAEYLLKYRTMYVRTHASLFRRNGTPSCTAKAVAVSIANSKSM